MARAVTAMRNALASADAAYRRARPRRAAVLGVLEPLASGRRGFEVGGPSEIFSPSGPLPVYEHLASLDNANYSDQTLWEGTIEQGQTFTFHPGKPAGRAYIAEATDLRDVPSEGYEVLLSSHTLEHVADPLRALREWMRILEPGGALCVIVPQREATFDHRRPVTTLEHLIEDERRGTGEDDLTHLPEILELHDLQRDVLAGTPEQFEARCRENLRFRAMHQHVFDVDLLSRALGHVGAEVLATCTERPFHVIAVARKPA